jgi:hypothetical protein
VNLSWFGRGVLKREHQEQLTRGMGRIEVVWWRERTFEGAEWVIFVKDERFA